MSGGDFTLIAQVVLFMATAWLTGTLFGFIRFPPLLGWIIVGICLGPQLADYVPYASDGTCNSYRFNESLVYPDLYACFYDPGNVSAGYHCPEVYNSTANATNAAAHAAHGHQHRMLASASSSSGGTESIPQLMVRSKEKYQDNWRKHCMHASWQGHHLDTNIWQFIGNVGVGLMIFESGMHIHFDKVRLVGHKAFFVAVLGTGLPLLFGMALIGAMFTDPDTGGGAFYPDGLSAGVALAPTSVAIAIKVLDESKKLNTIPGQTILLAAFVDDIFSLVMLGIMIKITEQDDNSSAGIPPEGIILPIIYSFAFIGVAAFLAIYVFPKLRGLLDRIKEDPKKSFQPKDMVHLGLMFLVFFFASWLASLIGSFLLGAFSAGMCFVNVARSQLIWRRQVKRIANWAMVVFFASSVGFSVPLSKMMDGQAFGYGCIIAVGPTVLAKILSGFSFCEDPVICCLDAHERRAASLAAAGGGGAVVSPRSPGHGGVAASINSRHGGVVGGGSKLGGLSHLRTNTPPGNSRPSSKKQHEATIPEEDDEAKEEQQQQQQQQQGGGGRRAKRTDSSGSHGGGGGSGHGHGRMTRSYSAPSMRELERAAEAEAKAKTRNYFKLLRPSWAQFMVGFAMVGRGEFAYLVAETMNRAQLPQPTGSEPRQMMSDQVYAVVMWALIISTITAPFGFRWAVKKYAASKPMDRSVSIGGDMLEHAAQKFYVKLIGQHHVGLLHELLSILNTCGLDVLEAKAETDNEIDYDTFLVQARGDNKDFDDEKLEEIQHAISEVVNDKESQVIFERCELEEDFRIHGVLEIRVLGDHHPDILHEITDMLSLIGLDVFKAATEAHEVREHGFLHREEEDIFYARSPPGQGNGAILPATRAKVRTKIVQIMKTHDMHGEVMVKVIHEDEAAIHHHLPNFDTTLTDMIATIRCNGPHHKEQLHEICDFLADKQLDVLHAELDHHGTADENVFCVAHVNQETPIDMAYRQDIRQGILAIFRGHNTEDQCTVTVRQYGIDKALSESAMTPNASFSDLEELNAMADDIVNDVGSPRSAAFAESRKGGGFGDSDGDDDGGGEGKGAEVGGGAGDAAVSSSSSSSSSSPNAAATTATAAEAAAVAAAAAAAAAATGGGGSSPPRSPKQKAAGGMAGAAVVDLADVKASLNAAAGGDSGNKVLAAAGATGLSPPSSPNKGGVTIDIQSTQEHATGKEGLALGMQSLGLEVPAEVAEPTSPGSPKSPKNKPLSPGASWKDLKGRIDDTQLPAQAAAAGGGAVANADTAVVEVADDDKGEQTV